MFFSKTLSCLTVDFNFVLLSGCEFVKAVAGFNCRLCRIFIRYGKDVSSHIQARKHQRNYEVYPGNCIIADYQNVLVFHMFSSFRALV